MATPNRTPDEAERVVSASSRELRAAAQMLDTYVVNGEGCPQPVRDEAERVLRTISYEADKLAEILPTMRLRADSPEAAAARAEADKRTQVALRAAEYSPPPMTETLRRDLEHADARDARKDWI